jgi:heme A synthase
MSASAIFQYSSAIAMMGWLFLIIGSPFAKNYAQWLIGIFIVLLALIYTWLISQSLQPADFGKFGTLEGVMGLFTNPTAVTAGWVHYLAFDLLVGVWIKNNALKHQLPHVLTVPCLLFTFMMGPVGVLLYLVIRTIKTKNYFAENF